MEEEIAGKCSTKPTMMLGRRISRATIVERRDI
jgi:hypothetical protein